jgi:hypothetical protein
MTLMVSGFAIPSVSRAEWPNLTYPTMQIRPIVRDGKEVKIVVSGDENQIVARGVLADIGRTRLEFKLLNMSGSF